MDRVIGVVEIARDPRYFRFISACRPTLPVVLGDARLTLAASHTRYDLIVLDAFSSDVIPVHLLTREAVAGYLARLAPGGIIAMHISNRHMDLAPVVAAVGAAERLVVYLKKDSRPDTAATDLKASSHVAVLARSDTDLGALAAQQDWRKMAPDQHVAAFTDEL